jgi:hypothetical protein
MGKRLAAVHAATAASSTTAPSWDAAEISLVTVTFSPCCRPPRDGSLPSINAVAIGGEADMPRPSAPYQSDAIDPQAT